jgi:hypothetical protein
VIGRVEIGNVVGEAVGAGMVISSGLKTEFTRESQVIIVQIREPKGVGKAFEEELKGLANVLANGYG